jgi:hypothetical protein
MRQLSRLIYPNCNLLFKPPIENNGFLTRSWQPSTKALQISETLTNEPACIVD